MIELISPLEHLFERGRRGIGFLSFTGNRFVNAIDEFQKLKESEQNRLWTNFRYWTHDNKMGIKNICHGYDRNEYAGRFQKCFQFKLGEHRFYGFLSNPLHQDGRFLLFTAVHHLEKRYHRTDESVLASVLALSKRSEILDAVRNYAESLQSLS